MYPRYVFSTNIDNQADKSFIIDSSNVVHHSNYIYLTHRIDKGFRYPLDVVKTRACADLQQAIATRQRCRRGRLQWNDRLLSKDCQERRVFTTISRYHGPHTDGSSEEVKTCFSAKSLHWLTVHEEPPSSQRMTLGVNTIVGYSTCRK